MKGRRVGSQLGSTQTICSLGTSVDSTTDIGPRWSEIGCPEENDICVKAIDGPESLGVTRYLRCEFGDTGYDSILNGYPNIAHKLAVADSSNRKRVIR